MSRGSLAWIGVGLLLSLGAPTPSVEAQNWRTVTRSRQVSDDQPVDVHVKYGAGRFGVRPAEGNVLYRMELTYDEDEFDPLSSFRSGRLELGIEGTSKNIDLGSGENRSRMDLELGRSVPMDLRLEFGAVRADLDLGGLTLTGLLVTTGASETRLDISEPNPSSMKRAEFEVGAAEFSARRLGNLNADLIRVDAGVGDLEMDFSGGWQRDARIEVHMGLGALEMRFPRWVGVRFIKDTFLTSLDLEDMVKRDGDYYSANWDSADVQIEVEVDAAFGSIKVDWVR